MLSLTASLLSATFGSREYSGLAFLRQSSTQHAARSRQRQQVPILNGARTVLSANNLDTCYEWIHNERMANDGDSHVPIDWIHMDDDASCESSESLDGVVSMPIYPLGAVYVPHSGESHTLVNTEERNVRMATDLLTKKWGDDSLFCVALRARDTGRLSKVCTVMRQVEVDNRTMSGFRSWPGEIMPPLKRVVTRNEAVGIAEINRIRNPDAKGDEYLLADVRVRDLSHDMHVDNPQDLLACAKLVEDYQRVRSIYVDSQSISQNELPKFARKEVASLPNYHLDDVTSEARFWTVVDTWQVLCNTIRQSKQTQMQGMLNELSVEAAMQLDGPLELPVKRERLPDIVQMQLEEIERTEFLDFIDLGMEPILDFQELLTMTSHTDRIRKLSKMISWERSRLETKEMLLRAFLDELEVDGMARNKTSSLGGFD